MKTVIIFEVILHLLHGFKGHSPEVEKVEVIK